MAISLATSIGTCGSTNRSDAPAQPRAAVAERPAEGEPEQRCAGITSEPDCWSGQACPSSGLPRFSTALDAAGWTRLQTLAEESIVAVVLGDERSEIIEGCELPGRYHEAAGTSDSPGRAWSSDRLSFLPDEPRDCGRATHFIASFAIRGDTDGEAIALPLPCPPAGSGDIPLGCIGAGLDDQAREDKARSRYERLESLPPDAGGGPDHEAGLPLMLEVTALMSNSPSYAALASRLKYLQRGGYGGCLWLSEAAFAARSLDPEFESVLDDTNGERLVPNRDAGNCLTRPSLLTCFPKRFEPTSEGNCW